MSIIIVVMVLVLMLVVVMRLWFFRVVMVVMLRGPPVLGVKAASRSGCPKHESSRYGQY